jgi:hypothetical protein
VRDAVSLLERAQIVDVETRAADGARHRVPIWVVTVDGEVYVASVQGAQGRWWRELVARGGALVTGGRRLAVGAHRVRSAATREAVSKAYARKYRGSRASVLAMQRADVLATTLRLELGAGGDAAGR